MIFGRKRKDPEPPDEIEEEEVEPEAEPESGELPEGDVDADIESTWRARAQVIIPGGASTGSKRAPLLLGDERGPTHFAAAHGCRVMTAGGAELVDCTMALGAVALGYGDERVTHAVADALARGNVSGLSSTLEVQLAERLGEIIPCAEQSFFFKSGGEAVAAAVRLARAHTGREHVVGSGYFGWQDWSRSDPGVPAGTRSAFTAVPFDDADALERACKAAGHDLAAIVLEPVVEKMPSDEWLAEARRWCERSGALLVFDEIKTGFRIRRGGYQELSGITPDLAVFGKAMANGFPLAAVVGRETVMRSALSTWVSSTLGGESLGLAAANAVVDAHEAGDVSTDLEFIGTKMRDAVQAALAASRCPGVTIAGLPQMWLLRFETEAHESRFLALARERGVLFKRGAYNFASIAHDDEALVAIEAAASTAFVDLREEIE